MKEPSNREKLDYAAPSFDPDYDDEDNDVEGSWEVNDEQSSIWTEHAGGAEIQYSPFGNDPGWDYLRRTEEE